MSWRGDPDPEPITGVRKKTQPSAGRSALARQWYDIVGDVVKEHGGDADLYYPQFYKHVGELRVKFDHDDEVIVAGFARFAEMVDAGKIDVRGKTAWLVFWSRRNKLVRTVVSDRALPARSEQRNPFDIERSEPRNPFEP